ncbi:dipeptide/oligopeptide/nickel ABC transporter permease/ATP-binding protein [Microbacterium horticulturae]|uniref:Dipeptide/oligopeptide/nickel ABC transporter permease/ATP-binding protein n=1 Tax=Microbacterium horticulturae TaxID=3028316 RepID=A0ABY8BW98_9MICO|nr:dipeptide/oligopeptide/nickel ABC transporter permease/ATP-binding protein [Microbacterium sp. KACC 23027]WEG08470.1 dipeptide/oligopeptide/nickel ABC transporter permease/ATP-binding protein [Microbacterium sp. KACC 23027]
MTQSSTLTLPVVTERASSRLFLWRLYRRPIAIASSAVLLVIVVTCACAPFFPLADPLAQDLSAVLQLPSAAHLLGTDALGRDVLSRLLSGGMLTLSAVLVALIVAGVIGPLLGIFAGYFGGIVDRLISGAIATMLTIPVIIILLAVLAVFPTNIDAAMITLGVLGAAPIALVVRTATRSIKQDSFIAAAELAGVSDLRIILRHVLPRLTGVLIVQLALFACVALVMQGGLAYLGLGIPQPQPSWGGGIAEAQKVIFRSQWLFVPYGGILAVTILSIALLGDAARDTAAELSTMEQRLPRRRATPRQKVPLVAATAASTSHPPVRNSLLTVRDLSVGFDGRPEPVVCDVSLEVLPGEVVGVVGESGSGKSTLMVALLGLLPGSARVIGGSAMLGDRELLSLDDRRMRKVLGREIGLIAQDPMAALDPAFTVGTLMDEIVRGHGVPRRAARERTLDLLAEVALPDPERVCRLYPHELSGGMAQRVCIAMAVSGRPQVLIADEATTALDVTVQAHILHLLRQLAQTKGMGVLLVTHNLGVVADICDRVEVMRDGRVVESGTVDHVFYDSTVPYVAELLAATPSLVPLESSPTDREPLEAS